MPSKILASLAWVIVFGVSSALPHLNDAGLTTIVIDGAVVAPSSSVHAALTASLGSPPWPSPQVAAAIFDFVGTARLRGPLSNVDALVDAAVIELAPYATAVAGNRGGSGGSAAFLSLARAVREARDAYVLARESPSQLGADGYALSRLPLTGHGPRYFVDAGCHHPFRCTDIHSSDADSSQSSHLPVA